MIWVKWILAIGAADLLSSFAYDYIKSRTSKREDKR